VSLARAHIRGAWCLVVALSLIGIVAAAGRMFFVADLAARVEPIRAPILEFFRVEDPHAAERPQDVARFDAPFAAHPLMALLHVVPGGLFLILGLLQFSSSIRNRYLEFHRWAGRLLTLLAFATGLSALFFGLFMPFGGAGESVAIATFGGAFLVAISRAFGAIRRGEVSRHREWMIRTFAIAIAISTVRVVAFVLDVALTPTGFRVDQTFVISLWIGWTLTIGAAEIWIRTTRPTAQPVGGDARRILPDPLARL
jgi:uncharacterized membrane protein